ncbi:MAG: sulfatase, partial [Myxococcota bacterium]|nr:sulfatase [Myxococcota bacterium]
MRNPIALQVKLSECWRKSFFLTASSVFVILCLSACGFGTSENSSLIDTGGGESATAVPTEPNLIILISIDTLRADHLGSYGYKKLTSPEIDQLAEGGVVFLDVSSTSPWTLPAHASMLTGLYPLRHQVINSYGRLPSNIPTLAKTLKESGWQSAAAVGSSWLLKENYGITRDFDRFLFLQTPVDQRLPSKSITDKAINWITDRGEDPLFLFLHYYDVHSDYVSLKQFENLFLAPYDGEADGSTWQIRIASFPEEFVELCRDEFDSDKCRIGGGESAYYLDASAEIPEFGQADIDHLKQRYDAGIRQLDSELARLFNFLEANDILESSLIALTSDHGEEFFEHGRFYHAITTYQETLRVPLIVRGPGVPAGLTIDAPISLVDLLPTLLRLAGVSAPIITDGIDLTPLLADDHKEAALTESELNNRFLYGEASKGYDWELISEGLVPIFHSVRKGKYKLIQQGEDQTPEL